MKTANTKIKQQILTNLEEISNPTLLLQILDFLRIMRSSETMMISNRSAVLDHAGSIDDDEAAEMKEQINREFSKTEGDW